MPRFRPPVWGAVTGVAVAGGDALLAAQDYKSSDPKRQTDFFKQRATWFQGGTLVASAIAGLTGIVPEEVVDAGIVSSLSFLTHRLVFRAAVGQGQPGATPPVPTPPAMGALAAQAQQQAAARLSAGGYSGHAPGSPMMRRSTPPRF